VDSKQGWELRGRAPSPEPVQYALPPQLLIFTMEQLLATPAGHSSGEGSVSPTAVCLVLGTVV